MPLPCIAVPPVGAASDGSAGADASDGVLAMLAPAALLWREMELVLEEHGTVDDRRVPPLLTAADEGIGMAGKGASHPLCVLGARGTANAVACTATGRRRRALGARLLLLCSWLRSEPVYDDV